MSREYIRDEKGRVIGSSASLGNTKTFSDASGRVIAREVSGMTLDKNGVNQGKGNQGLRLLNSNSR